ncbi:MULTISPECIES: hypothetical protein [Bacillus]|uniref:Uncharacterized protein n=1 Tax=Bacillus capparidis TaxID=1840411 RepID=A0ABS4CYB2_9BACI|nr:MULTISPECIES: hypothetical protein [Bacillus]MBP1082350.1 hypothetical protein [Bacillus capparidis]MED1097391.1 hypothetical protein [Bacillus capparidis]
MNGTASKTKEIKNPQKIQHLTDMSKKAISSKQVILNNSGADLVFDDAKFLDIKENNEKYASVTIPIVGEQYSFISNLTFVFDSEDNIISYSETLITKSDNNKFVVTTYFNGKLVQEKVTDIDYISNSKLQRELKYMQDKAGDGVQAQKSFNEVVLCISLVALIDLTVARLIAATCIASCPAVPAICAACIGAVAVVGGANIPAIISCFK